MCGCGQLICSTECCDPGCSACSLPSGGWEELCVFPRCNAMVAHASGDCEESLGFVWNGQACEELVGCECQGDHCSALHRSLAACEANNVECTGR